MGKTAIIYARVSTPGQAQEELPVESQLDTCRRRAAEIDAVVLREFVDAGISGRTDDRPAFREAIAFCRVNHVDYFICWSTSRFARNRIDAPWHKVQLKKHGTQMLYVSMNLDSSTKEGWMMEGMLELIDEYYSRQIADDTVRSMIKNAREGYFNGGLTPFGYQVVADGRRRRLCVNETEASVVVAIFSAHIDGAGAKAIALDLNARGVYRRGAPWSKTTIAALLKNWVYAGYTVFNRRDRSARRTRPESEWIRAQSHPAIIDEETFVRAEDMTTQRSPLRGSGSPRSAHLFTGLLKCGECGRSMLIETATGRSATYSYYNCGGHLKGHTCRARRISADAFDVWLASFIVDKILNVDNLRAVAREVHEAAGQWAKDRATRRTTLVAELRDVERRRRRLYDLLENSDPSGLNLGDVKPRLMELNVRARTIESSLTELEVECAPDPQIADDDLIDLQGFVRDVVLHSGSPPKIRQFFAGFIERIDVRADDVVIHYRKDHLVTAGATEVVHSEQKWLPVQSSLRTGRVVAALPDRFVRRAA